MQITKLSNSCHGSEEVLFGSRSRKLELRFYLDLTPKLTPLHFIIPLPVLVNQNVTVGKN